MLRGGVFLLGGVGRSVVFGCLRLCCLGVGDFCLLGVAVCLDTHPCALEFDCGSGYGALVAGMIMIEI